MKRLLKTFMLLGIGLALTLNVQSEVIYPYATKFLSNVVFEIPPVIVTNGVTQIVATTHNDLNGIQGGAPSDYYHVTLAQLNALVTGLPITIFNISNTVDQATNDIRILYSNVSSLSNTVVLLSSNNTINVSNHFVAVEGSLNYVSNNAAYLNKTNDFQFRPKVNGVTIPFAGEQPINDGVFIPPMVTTTTTNALIYISQGIFNLFNDITGTGTLYNVVVPETNLYLISSNEINYVKVFYAGSNSYYTIDVIPSTSNKNVRTIGNIYWALTNGVDDVNIVTSGGDAAASIMKEVDRLLYLRKFERYNGLIISDENNLEFKTSSGIVYYGLDFRVIDDAYSTNTDTKVWFHTNSNFTAVYTNRAVTNFYDDGTNWVTATTGKFIPNWVYLVFSDAGNELYIVLGNQYNDLPTAQNSTIPSLPVYIQNDGVLVGLIITEAGSTTMASISSAFSSTYTATVVTRHNNLAGLDGGGGGEFYHLTLAEYGNVIGITGDLTFETNRATQTELSISNHFTTITTNIDNKLTIETNRAIGVEAGITNWMHVFTNGGNTTLYGTGDVLTVKGTSTTDINSDEMNGIAVDGLADSAKGYSWKEDGVNYWDAQIFNNENAEFWYLYNRKSHSEPITISEGGRMGLNVVGNLVDYHSLFTGVGQDDAVWGGLYDGSKIRYYKAIIVGNGPPDTFKWARSEDGITYITNSATINCSLSPVNITNGVTLAFESQTGHTIGDYWSKNAFPQLPLGTLQVTSPKFEEVQLQPTIGVDVFLDKTFLAAYGKGDSFVGLVAGSTNSVVYVEQPFRFGSVTFFMSNNVPTNGVTLIAEFWDGITWSNANGDAAYGYNDGTANLTGNGVVSWNKYALPWVATNFAGYTDQNYWMRFRSTTTVSNNINILKLGSHSGYLQTWFKSFYDDSPAVYIDGDGNLVDVQDITARTLYVQNLAYSNAPAGILAISNQANRAELGLLVVSNNLNTVSNWAVNASNLASATSLHLGNESNRVTAASNQANRAEVGVVAVSNNLNTVSNWAVNASNIANAAQAGVIAVSNRMVYSYTNSSDFTSSSLSTTPTLLYTYDIPVSSATSNQSVTIQGNMVATAGTANNEMFFCDLYTSQDINKTVTNYVGTSMGFGILSGVTNGIHNSYFYQNYTGSTIRIVVYGKASVALTGSIGQFKILFEGK